MTYTCSYLVVLCSQLIAATIGPKLKRHIFMLCFVKHILNTENHYCYLYYTIYIIFVLMCQNTLREVIDKARSNNNCLTTATGSYL